MSKIFANWSDANQPNFHTLMGRKYQYKSEEERKAARAKAQRDRYIKKKLSSCPTHIVTTTPDEAALQGASEAVGQRASSVEPNSTVFQDSRAADEGIPFGISF